MKIYLLIFLLNKEPSVKSDHDEELNNRESEHDENSVVYETPDQNFKILKDKNDDSELENYSESQSHSQQVAKNLTKEYERQVINDEDQEEYEESKFNHDTNNPLETVGEATIEETTKQNITLEDRFLQEVSDQIEKEYKDNGKRNSKFNSKVSTQK